MRFTPRNYQQFTIDFIEQTPTAAIFLKMGLGKTVSALTAINNLTYDTYEIHKTLIIAPKRVAESTWPAELKKWDHLTHLTHQLLAGTRAQRERALQQPADIYIISRENLVWLIHHLGPHWDFDMVVIDELSGFKNHQAKRVKNLIKIRPKIRRIVGLTGSPSSNGLLDLWAPFRILDQGQRLGKYITHYRTKYFLPDKRDGQRVFSWKIQPGAEDLIYQAIEDITISMETTDYLDLPPLTITDYPVRLEPAARRHYNQLKKDMITTIDSDVIDAKSAGMLSAKLQQLASGAIYGEDGQVIDVHEEKIKAIEEIIEAAQGNTVLIAYWFKHELHRLKQAFPHGRELDTNQDIDDWNNGKIPIMFLHPASAGHGLNLQHGGHTVVWMSTPWSLEMWEQTNARLFRQGQTQPVTVIRVKAEDTIDAKIFDALERKNTDQTALIDAVKAELDGAHD